MFHPKIIKSGLVTSKNDKTIRVEILQNQIKMLIERHGTEVAAPVTEELQRRLDKLVGNLN